MKTIAPTGDYIVILKDGVNLDRKVAKEAGLEQQAHTSSDQFFSNFAIQHRIHGANEIGKFFGIIFVASGTSSASMNNLSHTVSLFKSLL
jgi:hypothetical protein